MSACPATLDELVLAALAAGNAPAAAEATIRALGPDVLGYLAAVLRDGDDAREAFAVWSEQVLKSIEKYRAEAGVKTWAYRIAWRSAMRVRQMPHRRRERRMATSMASELAAQAPVSTPAYRRSEAKSWLERVRSKLTPAEQSLLTLRVDRELPWEAVAQIMDRHEDGGGPARLRKRFERLRERLRKAAERDGLLDE